MEFTCDLCGSGECRRLFPARDLLYGTPGEFGVVRCASCGLCATRPVVHGTYGEDYAPHLAPDVRPLTGLLRRIFDQRTYWIPPLRRDARVLEIGCGSGGFLRTLAGRGWELHGVDPATRGRDLFESRYPTAHFDAVFAWMVLEHVPRPRETVAEIARVLAPRGWFAFSVPNAASWEFDCFRDAWYSLQVPTHVTHFGERDLRRLIAGAGLRMVRVEHQRNLTSVVGSLGLRHRLPSLVRYAQRPPRWGQALLYPIACLLAVLREGGRLTAVARRGE